MEDLFEQVMLSNILIAVIYMLGGWRLNHQSPLLYTDIRCLELLLEKLMTLILLPFDVTGGPKLAPTRLLVNDKEGLWDRKRINTTVKSAYPSSIHLECSVSGSSFASSASRVA